MTSNLGEATDLSALKRRLAHVTNLPTLPSVALQIVEMARDPDVGLAEVADLITMDPALAGKVLRLANSPVYSRQRHIDNVRQALVLFGLDGALTVALSFSVARLVEAEHEGESGLDFNLFWRRSLATAAAAPLIASRTTFKRVEELFLAGLIQDIGMLAMDLVFPDLYHRIGEAQDDHAHVIEHELDAVGVHHGDATVWMLERWNFPESIIRMVEDSHVLGCRARDDAELAGRILHVATLLADAWWHPERERVMERFAGEAGRLLALSMEEILEIVDAFAPEVIRVSEILDTDVGDPVLLASVAEEARELLMLRNLQSLQQTQEMEQKAQRLEVKASTDPLTGAANRGHFDEVFANEFATAHRHGWPLSLMLADLDHFKRINDTHGHQVGDRVLREVVHRMSSCLRKSDLLARYGGEEFALILPGTRREGARVVAQRILEALRERPVETGAGGLAIPVTLSLGLAVMNDPQSYDSPAELLRAADRALYEAKAQGRDRLVEADGEG